MEASNVDRFIGPRKVEAATVREDIKTPGGNEVVEVFYAGGYKEILPKVTFEATVLDRPTDYTALAELRANVLIKALLPVVAEHDLTAGEIDNIKNGLARELFNSFNRATHFLWTKDDTTFTPGFNVVLDRSLLEADLIIREIPVQAVKEPAKDESIPTDAPAEREAGEGETSQ